jgi:hypothetical protein
MGAVMGYTPQEVRAMSVWQYLAARDGWFKYNVPDDGKLNQEEEDALWEMVQRKANGTKRS